jgi:hypothetical protein
MYLVYFFKKKWIELLKISQLIILTTTQFLKAFETVLVFQ